MVGAGQFQNLFFRQGLDPAGVKHADPAAAFRLDAAGGLFRHMYLKTDSHDAQLPASQSELSCPDRGEREAGSVALPAFFQNFHGQAFAASARVTQGGRARQGSGRWQGSCADPARRAER